MKGLANPDWLAPAWHGAGVGALMTTRVGGASHGPFESLNLRDGIGDDPASVARNQAALALAAGGVPVWLNQVHGARVVRLGAADLAPGALVPSADACVTTEPGIGCAVQVADCLPVLFAAPRARVVGAAHAGWRGLAGGVLEATLEALCEVGGCAPADVRAWLGACIGPRRFEVGADVLAAFGASAALGDSGADSLTPFLPHAPGKWLANLPLLARDRLLGLGMTDISGGTWCTVEDPSRFFSFRRDGITGRMAAVTWLDPV